jgi:ankyrin repeat protein
VIGKYVERLIMSSSFPSKFKIVLQVLLVVSEVGLLWCMWQSSHRSEAVSASEAIVPPNADNRPGQHDRFASSNERSPRLFEAVYREDIATLRRLLESGMPIDASFSEEGLTPLAYAAFHGKLTAARFLLSRGADINAVSLNGYTPLITAIVQEQEAVAILLLEKGADSRICTPEIETTLMLAADHGSIELVRRLVQKVDVNLPNRFGQRTLSFAIHRPVMLKLLLEHGADPNATIHEEYEDSVFLYAVRERALNTARMMLKHGAQVNFEGRYGQRALDIALQNRDKAMIRLLDRHGAVSETDRRANARARP